MYDTKKANCSNNEDVDLEAPGINLNAPIFMPKLPKPLSLLEKKYLLAVERGDMGNVRRMLQKSHRYGTVNINCIDPLGRGAINITIDNENLEMLELLIVMGVAPNDALLQAIDVGFVEAVELLLEFEELTHQEGTPYSWEKVDMTTSSYPLDITPIILAAHRNNYEILKVLLDRGATLPMPHDIKCGCESCLRDSESDSLRFSLSRVNEYRALASPSLIALSSNDPILTAFQLSWELRNLAFTEQESKTDYLELRKQCQDFAVDLLNQTRSSTELAIILNHDPDCSPAEEGGRMKLTRLELAIQMKQKKFVAHRNVQQLLAALWYDGLPGFRRKSNLLKFWAISKVALLFPLYCLIYMIAPDCRMSKLMRKPFMKFLIYASSYLFFLFLLILVSQHAEKWVIFLFDTNEMEVSSVEAKMQQRGLPPTVLEWIVVFYVFGFMWQEVDELRNGFDEYVRDLWNVIDCIRNSLYVFVIILRGFAYFQQSREITEDPSTAFIPRELWYEYDPQLISEGMFAAANIFSALKLVHLFSINPHLGPLQISLGRMVIDIIKFFFIYTLVLFAFACGLNQLLGYFAELERNKCYAAQGGLPDWENQADACTKWRRFANLFESSQSLFWASFGMVGIDAFELSSIKSYTRFWGLLMFGCYSVINVIVLLNLLIAMMSNSFSMIEEHADTEWKFARTRLWMSYFEENSTLPPPFNIIPAPKHFLKVFKLRQKDKIRRMNSKKRREIEKERDFRYAAVIRTLVWRYVRNQQKISIESPVTEDDINEVKGEITAMKYDLLEVLSKNGMDTSSAEKDKDRVALGKKDKIWERRLMKDFHLAPVAAEEELHKLKEPPENEDPLDRFRRVAKLAVVQSTQYKWKQVVAGACEISKIGRGYSVQSMKNQKNLQMAMEEAQRLMAHSPVNEIEEYSPIKTPEVVGGTLKELVEDFKEECRALYNDRNAMQPSSIPTISGRIDKQSNKDIVQTPTFYVIPPSPSTSTKECTSSKEKEYLVPHKRKGRKGGWM